MGHREAAHGVRAVRQLNIKLADPVTFRPRDQIARFLEGLELLEPGVVPYHRWHPAPDADTAQQLAAWCAVARKE